MRAVTTPAKIHDFMRTFASRVGEGQIFFTGGVSALLMGWRETTIDIDLKADPEPSNFFEAIAELKETLDINIELASPDQFIPALPHWRARSIFIQEYAGVTFFHYDFYSQSLAKIERGHTRDLSDVQSMIEKKLVIPSMILTLFGTIAPSLIRFPRIDPVRFQKRVRSICGVPPQD